MNITRYSRATAEGYDNLKFVCKIYPKIKSFQGQWIAFFMNKGIMKALTNPKSVLKSTCGSSLVSSLASDKILYSTILS